MADTAASGAADRSDRSRGVNPGDDGPSGSEGPLDGPA